MRVASRKPPAGVGERSARAARARRRRRRSPSAKAATCGRWLTQREHVVVRRRRHLFDAHARPPPRARARAAGSRPSCAHPASARSAVRRADRRTRRRGARVLGAGDGVAAEERVRPWSERPRSTRGDHGRLHAAGVGDDRAGRQRAARAPATTDAVACTGDREHDEVGVARGARGIALGAVDQAARGGPTRDSPPNGRSRRPRRRRRARAAPSRATRRSDRRPRSAARSATRFTARARAPPPAHSTKREFSAGVPTVTRR